MKQVLRMLVISAKNRWAKELAFGVLASLLLVLGAPLSIHLPYSPIPVTVQVQLALVLSALLGPRKAVWMIIAFLTQGLLGWPVFAGGASTIATLIGPRGGYLFGYLIAAYVVGKLYSQAKTKSAMHLLFSMLVGNLIIYVCGFSWLTTFVGIKRAFLVGIAPFALPDLVKLLLFTSVKAAVHELMSLIRKN